MNTDEFASLVMADRATIFQSREGKKKRYDKLTDICREKETKTSTYFLNQMSDVKQPFNNYTGLSHFYRNCILRPIGHIDSKFWIYNWVYERDELKS